MTKVKVAVLGPKGTNTEEVAEKCWGDDVELHFFAAIPEIFDSVMKRDVDYGIVPVEDNIEGDVQGTLNLFRTHEVFITKELHHDVRHWLLAKGRKDDIKKIVSHPQALLHCRWHLDKLFPGIPREVASSTAEAARRASENPSIGAIANERNAKIYGLNIIGEDIHDWGSNTTKFFCIGNSPEIPEERPAKTSVIIYPKLDHPGVLCDILGKFKKEKINLTQIESQPSRGKLGNYLFYLTFEGSKADSRVQSVWDSIDKMEDINLVRYLGSYSYEEIQDTKGLNLPKDTININEKKIEINASNLELGISYPIEYRDKKHLIRRPHKGIIQLYKVN